MSTSIFITGPNASVCTGNGEWKPDPGEVHCIGELHNHNGVSHGQSVGIIIIINTADCGVSVVDRTRGFLLHLKIQVLDLYEKLELQQESTLERTSSGPG